MGKRSKPAPAKRKSKPAPPAPQKPKGPGGRPTLFSAEIGLEIAKGVEEIGWLAVAAEHVGIHRNTAYAWQKAGLAGDPQYAEFAHQVTVARAAWYRKQLGEVQNPVWLLERADPTLFGPKAEPPVQVNVTQAPLTREQALEEIRRRAELDAEIRDALGPGKDGPR